MAMDKYLQAALNAALSDPRAQQCQLGQNFANIMQTGDVASGEALANQILQQTGLTKEQALAQAQQGLAQMFNQRR